MTIEEIKDPQLFAEMWARDEVADDERGMLLPVAFDDDYDLVDAKGAPLFYAADLVDHSPDIGRDIAKAVNYHERLVKSVRCLLDFVEDARSGWDCSERSEFLALLEELEAK